MTPRIAATLKLLVMAAGLAAAGLLLRAFGAAPGTEWVDLYVRGQGLGGELVFVGLGAAMTAVLAAAFQ